jgi:hypothetical protein
MAISRPGDCGRLPSVDERAMIGKRLLVAGGALTALASCTHVAIILGGPHWYRFFGAGERMAQLAARGAWYPTVVTSAIAAVLAIWALYAFSGAGLIRRLPLLRTILTAIATVFLARGLFAIPAVWFFDGPYVNELRSRMTFMLVSSATCVCLGVCYAVGASRLQAAQGCDSASLS